MRATIILLLLAAAATPSAALAQSEDQLRTFFEGKTVRVKIEMPGTEDGVDVYPGTAHPIDFPKHATRLKRSGTALRRGDEVLVTKVKVKKDLIEFQLGGGGYGTFGDDDNPNVFVPSAPKTERENARNQAEAAQARQTKEANIRQRRLEGGSRFNLRYNPVVPSEALTPDGVMQALAEYVDFAPIVGERAPEPAPRAESARGDLRKGLTVDEVDALLGRPDAITQRSEGTLKVSTSTYRSRDRAVTAEFVEGVLIRFTITSP